MLSNLSATAARMERYTASLRKLNSLEDTMLQPEDVDIPTFLESLTESLQVLVRPLSLNADFPRTTCHLQLDPEIICRVLENLATNAARYAEHSIQFTATIENNLLLIQLADDGPGFPSRVLTHRAGLFPSDIHMGLGLAASRILCLKHGGALTLSNLHPHGACAQASFAIDPTSSSPT